jgi:hypothetical protein
VADYSMAIVLGADGTAMIGTFDAATGSMVKLQQASEVLGEKLDEAGDAGETSAEKIKKTGNEADGARKKFGELGDAIEKKFTQGVKIGVAGIAAMVGLSISAADRAGKLAEKLGVGTEFISAMGYAADQTGANLNVLTSGLGTLADNATKAAGGSRQSAASFAAIGVSVVDANGKLKSLEQLLPEIADRFAGIENGAGKAAIANRLFGSSGRELIPMLNQGAAGLGDMTKAAAEMGLVISGDTAKAASQLGDNIGLLKANFMGMATTLAERLLPTLVSITSHTDSIVNIVTLLGSVAAAVYAGKLVKGALDYGSALSDLVFKSQSVATAEVARGAASDAASGLSFKSLGALQSGFLLVQAAVVGWSIGTYLRDEFRIVADAGDYLVYGIAQGWENIKYSTQVLAAYIKAAFLGSLNVVRENLAGLIGMYANAAEKMDAFGLGADAIAQLREWEGAIRPVSDASDELDATLSALGATYAANSAENAAMLADMQATTAATHGMSNSAKDAGKAIEQATAPIPPFGNANDEAAKKVRAHALELERLASSVLVNRDNEELLLIEMALEEAQLAKNTKLVDLLTRAYEAKGLAIEANRDVYRDYASVVLELNAGYDEEIRLAGLSNEQRIVEEQLLRVLADAKRDGVTISEEEQNALRGMIGMREQHLQAVERERQGIERNQGIIRDGFYALVDATADWASGSISSFKDMAKRGMDIIKNMVIDMLANIFKMRVVEPFLRGLFGGGGSSGGWGNVVGSLMGGGSSSGSNPWLSMVSGSGGNSGGMLNGLMGLFGGSSAAATPLNSVGPLAGGYSYPTAGASGGGSSAGAMNPWLGAVAGGLYGLGQGDGGIGTAASTAAGAVAGYSVAAAYTAGAAAAAAAGGAATAGGLAAGSAAGLAAVPVIGWVALIALVVDKISGGKVFGTKYRPEEQRTTFGFGAEGTTASNQVQEWKYVGGFGNGGDGQLLMGGWGRKRRRTRELGVNPEALEAIEAILESVKDTYKSAAGALETEVLPVLDATFETIIEYTKKGKVKSTKTIGTILGETYAEPLEAFQQRMHAEGIIATLDASLAAAQSSTADAVAMAIETGVLDGLDEAGSGVTNRVGRWFADMVSIPDGGPRRGGEEYGLPGIPSEAAAMMGEASTIAQRWRDDAALLLEGASFLLLAQTAINEGANLLGDAGTLTGIADLTEEMARGEETLSETFVRLLSNTESYRAALNQMGRTLDIEGAAFVQLATDIVDESGGLEKAQAMWQAYFDGFYTAAERARYAQDELMSVFGTQAGELGLDPSITTAQFREAFEEALPNLSASEIVAWQQFGQLLLHVAAARAEVTQAEQAHAQWMQQLTDETTGYVESGFQQAMRAIRNATAQHIANADALAQAQGREGASTTDLALIHRWAARQIELAIQALESVAMDLAAQLGYGALTQIEQQIAAMEANGNTATAGIEDAGIAADNFFQQFADGLRSLGDYFDSLLLGDLSPLSPEDQIAEARRQLEANAAAVRAGDVGALSQSQGLIETFLRLMRGHEASGDDYTQEFNWAQGLFAGIGNPYSPAGGGAPGPVELVPSAELIALYTQRDQLMAEQDAAQRAAIAAELAVRIHEIINARNLSLEAVAQRLGVPLDLLVADLIGVNVRVDALTASVVQQLGGVANQVGVELSELAQALGIEIGVLTSASSLLNDSLELVIAGLPEEFRAQLEPLLRNVEDASSPDSQVAALGELERVTGELPEELRLLLAPYLDGINPLDPTIFTDLDYLSSVDANTSRANELLEGILLFFTGGASTNPPPETPIGPTATSPGESAMSVLTPVGSGGQASNAMLLELQKLRTDVAMLTERLADATERNTQAVHSSADKIVEHNADTTRRLGDDLRSNARAVG